jgi:urease accessory protein
MRRILERCSTDRTPDDYLELDFDARQKSLLRTHAISGDEVGLFLERGSSLKDGDLLKAEDGRIYQVRAKPEPVSVVRASTAQDLGRLGYHLGNRHVRLEVGFDFVRYERDHVLDDMVQKLGFSIFHDLTPFEPEPGAYDRSHSHSHAHAHSHAHSHADDHEHGHPHTHPHSHEEESGEPFRLTALAPGSLLLKTP